MLTVEDMQQEFVCNINIKHRFFLNSYFLYSVKKFLESNTIMLEELNKFIVFLFFSLSSLSHVALR